MIVRVNIHHAERATVRRRTTELYDALILDDGDTEVTIFLTPTLVAALLRALATDEATALEVDSELYLSGALTMVKNPPPPASDE